MTQLFAHPQYLLLVLACLPAGLLFFFRFGRLKKSLLPLISGKDAYSVPILTHIITARFFAFALAWIFLVCAAASPRWGSELVATRQEGASVVFVLDVSRSMTVTDILPSRLAFASRYAYLLTGRLGQTPCAVVLVKGTSVLAIPLTTDHRSVLDLLSLVSPAMLSSPGSGIGRGVQTALEAFPANSTSSRNILLLTDGDETSSSLLDAARSVKTGGANLIIVGIGTPSGAELNVFSSGEEKRMQTTVLREDLLIQAVKSAGPQSLYVRGTETGSAQKVLDAVRPVSGGERKLVYSQKPVYRYFEFLLLSLACICVGFIAGGFRWRKK